MNANSLPQTQVIKDWLTDAIHQLSKVGITSTRLDAEIILAHTMGKSRTYLHAHDNEYINSNIIKTANDRLAQRLNRVPIAYIVGYKEFYGRQFVVSPATLIPRPESEDIINILKKILTSTPISHFQTPKPHLVDVGTGSGCLGITAKLEFPKLKVTLTDISNDALKVASLNAKKLSSNVNILKNDLLLNYSDKSDIIIANLPYVDQSWDRSPETNYEPQLALFAENHGLFAIEKIIKQAQSSLKLGGYLIIEADPAQHCSLIEFAKKQSLITTHHVGYVIAFKLKL